MGISMDRITRENLCLVRKTRSWRLRSSRVPHWPVFTIFFLSFSLIVIVYSAFILKGLYYLKYDGEGMFVRDGASKSCALEITCSRTRYSNEDHWHAVVECLPGTVGGLMQKGS